ncbi:hypothetical protein [uncultured Chryseobacterium sp.]|uniref:hypothetical protein n=1 Tax=uncultured Chryseobacterium sp. TaxID=259322 RepID=UPI0025E2FF44|nr:hypothetical protein [uncultured Chryseobacterium sp.]
MDNITTEINTDIAQFFITDSKQFLFRYQKLRKFQNEISSRSKLLIDLMFAAECMLKALIFLESQEDEKKTYKKIKTHNLNKLCNLIRGKTGVSRLKIFLSQNPELYDVSSRYTLEAHINFRENNVLGEHYYSTIASPQWLDSFYEITSDTLSYVESEQNFEIKSINFNDIDVNKQIEKNNRIKSIAI